MFNMHLAVLALPCSRCRACFQLPEVDSIKHKRANNPISAPNY